MAVAKEAFHENTPFTSKLDFYLRKKLVKWYIWSVAMHGVESWALRKGDQKYLESYEIWCWRRMEKISWTDQVRNEVLQGVKDGSNNLQTIGRKAKHTAHIFCTDCHLKSVIARRTEGRIEVTRRQGRRHKQLLITLTFKHRIKSHLPFACIIRSSPYSPRFQDKG